MPSDLIEIRLVWPFLRSRHLPFASTEGGVTRNLNEIGVRLWT